MKFWTITGMGYKDLEAVAYDMHNGRNPRGWDHFTYIIKAENVEAAYRLFDKHVGHNSFEGFVEFAKEREAAQMNIMYIAGEDNSIWRTPRYGADTRLV